MESAQSIERKFLGRDNRNLTDKFAKHHERDALWPGFRRAQEEMDRLRGWQLPTIDFNITSVLKRGGGPAPEQHTTRAFCNPEGMEEHRPPNGQGCYCG